MGSFLTQEEQEEGEAGAPPAKTLTRVTTANVIRDLDASLLAKLVLHRGYHDVEDVVNIRPLENTLEAFTKGWKMGVRYCECDITVTQDGKVILAHDNTLERVSTPEFICDSKKTPLSDLTFAEICKVSLKGGGRVPLLEQVLEAAIECAGRLVIEFKSDGDWQRLVDCTLELFDEKPHLFKGVGIFMSFNHLIMKRLKEKLQTLGIRLPPFLGLTDTHSTPGYEDIVWNIEDANSVTCAEQFMEDFNLDGLYVKYEKAFEDKQAQQKLAHMMKNKILGIWDAPDTIEDLQKWANFGFVFVNTDLTKHFTRIAASREDLKELNISNHTSLSFLKPAI